MIPVDDRPADAGAGQVDHFLQFTFLAETLEAITCPVRDQQAQRSAPPVKGDPMGIIQVLLPFSLSAEKMFQSAGTVVLKDILGAVTIGDKDVSVGVVDDGLRRYKLFCG